MNILQRLAQLQQHGEHPLVVAIDGGSGAGKTTLAAHIAEQMDGVAVISTDDFLAPLAEQTSQPGTEFDWRRLKEQVLLPLAKKQPIDYWRYDRNEPTMQQWLHVTPQRIVIIEGSYSSRLELASYYDVKIWLDAPEHVRLARMVEKDGEHMRCYWQQYLPKETAYMASYLPQHYAEMVIDGTQPFA